MKTRPSKVHKKTRRSNFMKNLNQKRWAAHAKKVSDDNATSCTERIMEKPCCAYRCNNVWKPNQEILYHKFPLNSSNHLEQWVRACRLENFTPTPDTVICSEHFMEEDYTQSTLSKKRLKRDVIPSVFNFPTDQEQNAELQQSQCIYVTKIKVEDEIKMEPYVEPYEFVESTSVMHKSTQTSESVNFSDTNKKSKINKILHQRLKRRNVMNKKLKDLIKVLRKQNKRSSICNRCSINF